MPKKKGQNKNFLKDFTLNDCANAPKPVGRVKKSTAKKAAEEDIPWDQVPDDDYDNIDIVEENNVDGTKNLVYNKKRNDSKSEIRDIDDRPGNVYPEIIFYLISKYIKPENVGKFAIINKTTYAITRKKSFWLNLYKRYCESHPQLPERNRIENSYRTYGLRQRVIRALFHTYHIFTFKVFRRSFYDCKPHELVQKRCVNVWYCKDAQYWSIFFKFKKVQPAEINRDVDIIKELGRIDANPEESMQVLEVSCKILNVVPPLMGMTLSSLNLLLSQGFRHHRMHLCFNSENYPVSKDILPECTVVLEAVRTYMVFDWWHPRYPHFENSLPCNMGDEEALPVLKKDFFSTPPKFSSQCANSKCRQIQRSKAILDNLLYIESWLSKSQRV